MTFDDTRDPYRSAGGIACPDCGVVLIAGSDGERICVGGCGTWLGNPVIAKLLPPESLPDLTRKLTQQQQRALAVTRTCPACMCEAADGQRHHLQLYKRGKLVLGICRRHGVWLDRRDHEAFRSAFAADIKRSEQEQVVAGMLQRGDGSVLYAFARRILELEAAVASLQQRLDRLERDREGNPGG